jgi:Leucine-rich repeat (LRR) protein
VKLPHEAIRSKISGENIVEVIEEDLAYFKNLVFLDISDNHISIEQILNLSSLVELNVQYNSIDHIYLPPEAFPNLEVLNLSYNKIPPSHIQDLKHLRSLK